MRTAILTTLTVFGIFSASTSTAQSGRTVGNVVDDTTIAAEVKAALVQADDVPGGAINVEVYQGNVQLAAFLESDAQIQAALSAAKSISGVKSVRNSLVEIEGGRSIGATIDDQVIHGKLETALIGDSGLGNAVAINTEVRRGHVLLSGFVSDKETRDRAEAVAKQISGVVEVHNRIDIM